jgi:two-component system CheB/CheR fusion protein
MKKAVPQKAVVKKSAAKKKPDKKKKAAKPAIVNESRNALEKHEKGRARTKPYPIVAIGASAGGLEAVLAILKKLPADTGMAFVYIQHLDPSHESMLSSILSKATRMTVVEAEEKMRIEQDTVYVIPPNKEMQIVDGVLTLDPRPITPSIHMSINRFFSSLAEKQKDGAVGIVLSGNATDGTLGLKAIKAAGGITMAQDASAKFQGMPRSAVSEGAADLVLSPEEIAAELVRISRMKDTLRIITNEETDVHVDDKESAKAIAAILQLLRRSTGVDFANYKKTTIHRRIQRRMLLFKLSNLKEYLQYLKSNTGEINALFNDLLINVTVFFRDRDLTEYLKSTILPKIIRAKKNDEPIRIWIPGCSTGQEAYSVAMLLMEVMGNRRNNPIQIFASDLSESAINKARQGFYSKSEVSEISPARLQRYFSREDSGYRILKPIRDLCVFAVHNVFKDPPFSRLDMISCCNLLIYLDTTLQKKALGIFHYSLVPEGYLVLGKTETVSAASVLFNPLSKKLKIFQRKKDGYVNSNFELNFHIPERNTRQQPKHIYHPRTEREFAPDLEKTIDNILLNRYIPACVVVNEDLEILQFRGSTGVFLEPAPGKASLNLLKMARTGLAFELRSAILKASKTGKPVVKAGIELKNKGASHYAALEIVPIKGSDDNKYFLVLFTVDKHREIPIKGKSKDARLAQLEEEITVAREDMSAIIEEREAMNEELQSANEEVVSSNEELQSINEELETSKEEIESANEELQTINQELQSRNDQFSEALNFSDAIFNNMHEALVVLNENLRVVRASHGFYGLMKTSYDKVENQLIFEFNQRVLDIPELHQMIDQVKSGNEFAGGRIMRNYYGIGERIFMFHIQRIAQQAMQERIILLTVNDITEDVRSEKILQEQEEWFRNMANNAPVMIWTSDTKGNITFFNKTWLDFTGKQMDHETGSGWIQEINPVDREALVEKYRHAIETKEPFQSEYRLMRHDGEYRWVMSSAKPLFDPQQRFTGFVGTVTEIHDQKIFSDELESKVQMRTIALQEANKSLEQSNSELQQFAYVASHDLQEPLRKMIMFSERMQEKFRSALPDDARQYLDIISKGASRMSVLIDDLLGYSRAIYKEMEMVQVDLNFVLRRALHDFDVIIQEKNAVVTSDPLPQIKAVPVQMHQLFHNLISNALKFTVPSKPPKIKVSTRIIPPEKIEPFGKLLVNVPYCDITFSDNGIGITKDQEEKIFSIFYRLHDKQAYPGTGIGLALCRKIVSNHNGMIYAEAEQNEGASFHVLLPLP